MTNCSILIPTYNRPQYLKRILNYYDDLGTDYDIIVADSSSDENKIHNKKIIISFSNLNISHLSNYSSKISMHHKNADALNYVYTKYCVICADDDFVTLNGINQSIDFLEKNLDFTAAHGSYVVFRLNGSNRKQVLRFDPGYLYNSITFPIAENRLFFHFSHYDIPTFYAVHRTDFLKMAFNEISRFSVNPILFGELLTSMLDLTYGKMKRLDVLYAARDADSVLCGCWPYSGYWPKLQDFIDDGTFDEEYAKFRECLAIHLSKKSQINLEDSRKVVDRCMSAYLGKYHQECASFGYRLARRLSKYHHSDYIRKISDILAYLRFPDWIDKGVRTSYRRIFNRKQMRLDGFTSSVDVHSSKYYDDFDRIRRHVLLY